MRGGGGGLLEKGAHLIYKRRWYQFSISGKAQVQGLLGHAAEDQNKIRTSSWQINHPGSVHTKFYSRDWLIQSIISEE